MTTKIKETEVVGVGSPIIDLLAQVTDQFIESIDGEKGGMVLVNSEEMSSLVEKIKGDKEKAPGGSVGNTIYALARLGGNCSFIGKLGKDSDGDYYRNEMSCYGVKDNRFKYTEEANSARCLSLITPDSQRTMRTDLGAAMLLSPDEISVSDFTGADYVHIEGYLLFNPDLAKKVLTCAHKAGCKVSLDLGSFEVVKAAGDGLLELLQNYVDIVFANEDESEAFCGSQDPLTGLKELTKYCDIAAVKVGAEGSWLARKGNEPVKVEPVIAKNAIDTTGAGDFWAAGFLYGEIAGLPLKESGKIGALLGCEVVQQIGADLPENIWSHLKSTAEEIATKR